MIPGILYLKQVKMYPYGMSTIQIQIRTAFSTYPKNRCLVYYQYVRTWRCHKYTILISYTAGTQQQQSSLYLVCVFQSTTRYASYSKQ